MDPEQDAATSLSMSHQPQINPIPIKEISQQELL
jgi:hypothetical protein